MKVARRRVPAAAGPPTGDCEGARPAASGRRDRDSGWRFRVVADSGGFDQRSVELPSKLAGSTADVRENPAPTHSCPSRFSEPARHTSLGSTHFASMKQPFMASRTRPSAVLRRALEFPGAHRPPAESYPAVHLEGGSARPGQFPASATVRFEHARPRHTAARRFAGDPAQPLDAVGSLLPSSGAKRCCPGALAGRVALRVSPLKTRWPHALVPAQSVPLRAKIRRSRRRFGAP